MIYEKIKGHLVKEDEDFLKEMSKNSERILELGTFFGKSACLMAETNENARIISVDNLKGAPDDNGKIEKIDTNILFDNLNKFENIIFIKGESSDISENIVENFDFMFIDAGHEYYDVLNDIQWLEEMLDLNGIIAFHDYHSEVHTGVKKAVDEFFDKDKTFEVYAEKAGSIKAFKKIKER